MLQQDRWWATFNAFVSGRAAWSPATEQQFEVLDCAEIHTEATQFAEMAHGPLADAIEQDAKAVMGGESE